MSYAVVPQRAAALGLFSNLPTSSATDPALASMRSQATATADQSKQEAIKFAEAQLQNYPPAAAVSAQYNKYKKYLDAIPNFHPSDLQDPEKCVQLLKLALINYARDNGIPTNTVEAKRDLEAYALSIASGYIGVPLPSSLPENATQLKQAAVDLACTAVMMETGIDPKLAVVTVECLLDGKLDASDCVAIGTCAGAIAGAVIGQAIGIPAPIGAFIGGKVGGMVGGTFAEIFGLVDPQEEVRALQAAFDSFRDATIAEAQKICYSSRSAYWDAFDNVLAATELQWETAEVKLGWRFGMRWFGQEKRLHGGAMPYSRAWDNAQQAFLGPVTTANRSALFAKNINYDTQDANGNYLIVPSYWCPFDYGCPYPAARNLGAGVLERSAQAFLAHGARWIPPASRNLGCVLPPPPSDAAFNGEVRERWLQSVEATIRAESASIGALQMTSVAVVGDLVRSAGIVAAEKHIVDLLRQNQSDINASALKRVQDLSAAKHTGTQLSDLLNYGALIVGAGVLGAALLKKESR